MPYLIDGYNLLHAMGLLGGTVGPHGLEKARAGLLGLVRGTHGEAAGEVTVVFDARHAPPGAEPEAFVGGIHVRFALTEEADDTIERLIRHDAAPKRLVVVSNDHRLQQAARRRGCPAWGCEYYLKWAERHRRERLRQRRPQPGKPEAVGPDEVARWLEAFGEPGA